MAMTMQMNTYPTVDEAISFLSELDEGAGPFGIVTHAMEQEETLDNQTMVDEPVPSGSDVEEYYPAEDEMG